VAELAALFERGRPRRASEPPPVPAIALSSSEPSEDPKRTTASDRPVPPPEAAKRTTASERPAGHDAKRTTASERPVAQDAKRTTASERPAAPDSPTRRRHNSPGPRFQVMGTDASAELM